MAACCLLALFVCLVARRVSSTIGTEADSVLIGKVVDQIHAGAEALGRAGGPTLKFDEDWFKDKCVKDDESHLFLEAKFQLSEHEESDKEKWEQSMKCVSLSEAQKETDVTIDSQYDCAKKCSEASKEHSGEVICCEFHSDKKRCTVRVGWQSLDKSQWGTNKLNARNWFFRDPKFARLFFTKSDDTNEIPLLEGEEMQKADAGRERMQDLIAQVNHMSIDGILEHLLSFYICLRWVPDEEFINLASFELTHVTVDQKTPKEEKVSREELIERYLTGELLPLRCGSAMNVQDYESMNKLIDSLKTENSSLYKAQRFSKKVAFKGTGTHGLTNMRKRVQKVEDALFYEGEGDSVYVKDMNREVRGELTWNTFLRPSNQFEQHVSLPKNQFMLCFGPRVASFPHKREEGGHVLADMNMAGCNGMWSLETITDHVERIKKLFAPEMCFESHLRRELKEKFMHTFVQMNEEFEKAMAGTFTKRIHELDPTKSKKLDLLKEDNVEIGHIGEDLKGGKAANKYERFAGMVAQAHSKWVLCEARDAQSEAGAKPFGNEDNFFRDPKAYDKWLGKLSDETVPECKTLDEATGCVKCVIAVKDKHGCHLRLDVKFPDIVRAIKDRKYPFLQSDYRVQIEQENKLVTVKKQGACLVRKSSASYHRALRDASNDDQVTEEAAMRHAFFQVSNDDTVVIFEGTTGESQNLKSTVRYNIYDRKDERAKFNKNPSEQEQKVDYNKNPSEEAPTLGLEALVHALSEENINDEKEQVPARFIFTDEVGAEHESNRQEQKVDYFVSCPCDKSDFTPDLHFQNVGSQGMAEYWNR